MSTSQWTIEYALKLVHAGLSLIPVSAQTKKPIEALLPQDPESGIGSWKFYQERLPTETELRIWLDKGAQLAVVCGGISGNLYILDFDVIRFYQLWRQELGVLGAGLVLQQTGGGGYQVIFRCMSAVGGNTKLAWVEDLSETTGRSIAIETRGEGGYAVLAPSLHPTGNYYQLLEGDLEQIPVLGASHLDALLEAARKLDEAPYTKQQLDAMAAAMIASQARATAKKQTGALSAIDAYNQAVRIEDALSQYNYHLKYNDRWVRPGGSSASVKVEQGKSFHHSSNDPMSDGRWHDSFDLYCFYEHANDQKSAVRAAATLLCLPPIFQTQTPGAQGVAPIPLPPAPTQSSLNLLLDANMTDNGNAECLASLYGDYLRYCHTRKAWLSWDGSRWRKTVDGIAVRFALSITQARYHAAQRSPNQTRQRLLSAYATRGENARNLSSMLTLASIHPQFSSTIDQYDTNPFLASTPSGTLDLETCTIKPADQNDNLSMRFGATYDAAATCPTWVQFINEVFSGDQDLIDFIQRAIGYSLTGDITEQCMFLCYGKGANGKSTLLNLLERLLGDYAGNASFSTFELERRSQIGEDLAELRGKRLVTMIESSEDRRVDEARIKQVTGDDTITCRFLYGQMFSYKPQYKLWMAMNYLPIIKGTDWGIWRRLILVPFKQNFSKTKDQQLTRKLVAELPGILNWALEGLHSWHAMGLGSCKAIEEATAAYRLQSDQLGLWLFEECFIEPTEVLPSQDGYQAYHVWSKNRGERALTQSSWSRAMGERGYPTGRQHVNKKQVTVYFGLRLREDNDPDSGQPGPLSQIDQDKQTQADVVALVQAGDFIQAKLRAVTIQGRKERLATEQWIERVERGDHAATEPIS